MKKLFFAFTLGVICVASCSKNESISLKENSVEQITKTFNVSMPETKTAINSLNTAKVLWSAGDAINVIGVKADGTKTSHTFSIASGQGTGSATFTGTVNADEVTFYALYPNNSVSWSGDVMTSENINPTQTAVAGSFDPSAAEMVAVADENDNLVFKHGRAYLKFTMGSENVTSVKFSSSNSRLASKNKYNMPACTINSTGGSQSNDVTLSGTFVQGKTYYVAIPLHKNAIGNLSVQFTFSGGNSSDPVSTTALSSIKPLENAGKVFNLGTIALSADPAFSASDVTIEADDKAGTIDFTVAPLVDGGVVTREVLAGATISNLTLGAVSFDSSNGEGSVSFTCDENTESDPKTATVRLTYTYNTNQTVTKDVTITQKKVSSGTAYTYLLYNSGSAIVQTKNEVACDYFDTHDTSRNSYSSSYSATSYTADGNSYTAGLKFNSSGNVTFTTHATHSTTVEVYYVDKIDKKTSKFEIRENGVKLFEYTPSETYNTATTGSYSGVVDLGKGAAISIIRTAQESSIILIKVIETE